MFGDTFLIINTKHYMAIRKPSLQPVKICFRDSWEKKKKLFLTPVDSTAME